jgi:hypothetical protein
MKRLECLGFYNRCSKEQGKTPAENMTPTHISTQISLLHRFQEVA